MLPLQKGLEYYYEQQSEFERREMPVEKQVALAFEAGFYAGRNFIDKKHSTNVFRYGLTWVPED
jgi:hypothetical protein